MRKHFYSHIVEIETIVIHLDEMDLSDKQRDHLIALIDTNLYHMILDVVLSELSGEDKKVFLRNLLADDRENLWTHLRQTVGDIEQKIISAAQELKEELRKDVQDAMQHTKT